MITQSAEQFLRQFDGDRADGNTAALDVGLAADKFGDIESLLEGFVELGTGVLALESGLVSLLQLTQYFRFSQDHGIQAGSNFEEMHQGFGFQERVNLLPNRTLVLVMVQQKAAQFHRSRACRQLRGRIDFHPIAC